MLTKCHVVVYYFIMKKYLHIVTCIMGEYPVDISREN